MRPLRLILPLLLAGLASALPNPQSSDEEVSSDDVLRTADSAGRYGQASGDINPDLISELFGSGQSGQNINEGYTPPKQEKQIVNTDSSDCSYYAPEGFECVNYHNCDDLGEIITDGGPGLIDIRGGFGAPAIQLDPENSKCPGDLEVCCRHPDFTAAVTGRPTKPTTTTTPKPAPYISRCGTRNENGIGVRIQNNPESAKTQFGEWPHMCAVLEKKNGKNLYVCGGSLISPGIVMTAAHCVDKISYENLKVRCGEWDTQQTVEPAEHQDRDVAHLILHPEYSSRNLSNDVALLHTTQEFILSAHVDVICLPTVANTYNFETKDCVATGWGKDDFDASGEYQTILKQVNLDLRFKDDCESTLRNTRLGGRFNLDDSAICAGGIHQVDTCKGDGGGPLVCPTGRYNGYGQSYVQAGIVGWGIGCGEQGIPGVYTDVAKAMCFIDWATKCVAGKSADFYGVQGCEWWAARQRRAVRRALASYEYQVNEHPQGSKTQRRILRRVKAHQEVVNKWDAAMNQCITTSKGSYTNADFTDYGDDDDDDYYDEYDNTDVSGYQRTSAQVGTRTASDGEEKAAEEEKEEVSEKQRR